MFSSRLRAATLAAGAAATAAIALIAGAAAQAQTARPAASSSDWIALPPGSITSPTQILCIAGRPCKIILAPGGGPGNPGGSPGDGGVSGGNNDTFCNELEANLDLSQQVVVQLLETYGCDV